MTAITLKDSSTSGLKYGTQDNRVFSNSVYIEPGDIIGTVIPLFPLNLERLVLCPTFTHPTTDTTLTFRLGFVDSAGLEITAGYTTGALGVAADPGIQKSLYTADGISSVFAQESVESIIRTLIATPLHFKTGAVHLMLKIATIATAATYIHFTVLVGD